MGDCGIRKPLKVIAALEHRDDAAVRARLGNLHDLLRCPQKVRFHQVQIGQRIALMRIEACRDHDQLWLKVAKARKDGAFECLAELGSAVAGREWRVDNRVMDAAFAARARAWLKRHLWCW